MEPEEIAIVAGFVVVYALLLRRFEISAVTSSMVFVAFGLAVSPSALDVVPLTVSNEVLLTLAEATLVLVLVTDAARIDIRRLRESPGVPARLLGIGMPLTIGLGTLLAMVLFDVLDGWEAFLVAAVLAPTDAALGQAVLSNRAVPARIRQALNVESGLNDGIAVPIIRVAIAGAVATLASDGAEVWIDFAAKQIGFGLLVGIGVGVVAGLAVHGATQRQWVSPTFQHIGILAVALLAFALAESVGGMGSSRRSWRGWRWGTWSDTWGRSCSISRRRRGSCWRC